MVRAAGATRWIGAATAGAAVLLLGILDFIRSRATAADDAGIALGVLVVLFVAAAACYRLAPGAALALVWVGGAWQLWRGLDIALVELGVVVVAYGCARWGRPAVLWTSGISVPLGAACAIGVVLAGFGRVGGLQSFVRVASGLGATSAVALLLVGLGVLAVPWLTGLVLRVQAGYRESQHREALAETEAQRQRDIASLREEQSRLARDVHDVVGHSLAVIVAQADAARAMPADDATGLQEALASIGESARRSLGEVRQVLASTRGEGPHPQVQHALRSVDEDLETLVEGVRAAGWVVEHHRTGIPRPLDADRAATAYRVLQEMLTNALKHGSRADALVVATAWHADRLELQVVNTVARREQGNGHGLDGMRERLALVGGELRCAVDDGRWTSWAVVPVGGGGS